jgi:hypothetical protein
MPSGVPRSPVIGAPRIEPQPPSASYFSAILPTTASRAQPASAVYPFGGISVASWSKRQPVLLVAAEVRRIRDVRRAARRVVADHGEVVIDGRVRIAGRVVIRRRDDVRDHGEPVVDRAREIGPQQIALRLRGRIVGHLARRVPARAEVVVQHAGDLADPVGAVGRRAELAGQRRLTGRRDPRRQRDVGRGRPAPVAGVLRLVLDAEHAPRVVGVRADRDAGTARGTGSAGGIPVGRGLVGAGADAAAGSDGDAGGERQREGEEGECARHGEREVYISYTIAKLAASRARRGLRWGSPTPPPQPAVRGVRW